MTPRAPSHALFRITTTLAAALLFLAEPIAARQLLPLFGGSAAVWITCLVFFQAALLAGYAYAHLLTTWPGRAWLPVHLTLLAGALTSAAVWTRPPTLLPGPHPAAAIFLRLTLSLGLPFLVLGATSPLLQVWHRRAQGGEVPYTLYSWSNAASLAALLAYPTLIEPLLSLHSQRLCWTIAFALFLLLNAVLARHARNPGPSPTTPAPRIPSATRLLWFALAMAASMQLSAVTAHLTGNVAAIPLLWIAPLAVYLLTFIAAFQQRVRIPRAPIAGVAAVLLIAVGNFLSQPQFALPTGLSLALFLAELAAACLFCHSELFRLRPATNSAATLDTDRAATAFYLTLAAGGATGALLIGILAPALFRANYDLSLTLAVTAAVALAAAWPTGPRPRLLWTACTAILFVLALQLHQAIARDTLMSARNFYGSLRVTQHLTPQGDQVRALLHGTITHGTQIFPAEPATNPPQPTAYYAPSSGIGLALTFPSGPRRIGVVGLGVGTLAAYARPADTLRFYELNPAVQPIAHSLFSYLTQAPAPVTILSGDGRALLARESPQRFDLLILDAFSGDAIPLHLLTLEAMQVYRRQLAPAGILAFHISNQYLDLEPELSELARAAGLQARTVTSPAHEETGEFAATWVLMSASPATLNALGDRAHTLRTLPHLRPWTDDYSSLLRLVRW